MTDTNIDKKESDWQLRQLRQRIRNEAHNLIYYETSLSALPNNEANAHYIELNRKGFEAACAHMRELLEGME